MTARPFDVEGYCASCGYRRGRTPDAACEWPEKHNQSLTELQEEQIRLYQTGQSINDVAAATGSTYNRVMSALKAGGVARRTLSQAMKPTSRWNFGPDGRCLSCGYGRNRSADAGCRWPDKHALAAEDRALIARALMELAAAEPDAEVSQRAAALVARFEDVTAGGRR